MLSSKRLSAIILTYKLETLMNLKPFISISVTLLSILGLSSLSELSDPAQAQTSTNTRTHCVWRKGKFGMQYKSCSLQKRVCTYRSKVGGGGVTTCTEWRNVT
jgi:hypothetical protein